MEENIVVKLKELLNIRFEANRRKFAESKINVDRKLPSERN